MREREEGTYSLEFFLFLDLQEAHGLGIEHLGRGGIQEQHDALRTGSSEPSSKDQRGWRDHTIFSSL